MRSLLPALALTVLGCRVQPLGLTCVSADATYTLTLANGATRTGELGCRVALQAATPKQSQRRLMLRLDTEGVTSSTEATGDTGAADTGGADTGAAGVEDWSSADGVVLGLAWSGWDKRLHHQLEIEPWAWPVPDNEGAFYGVAESFGLSKEYPETAVLAAFFTPDGQTERRELRSEYQGGWVQATRYVYQKKAGETAFLQVVIDDLELEDGALLDLEADVQFTGAELELPQ